MTVGQGTRWSLRWLEEEVFWGNRDSSGYRSGEDLHPVKRWTNDAAGIRREKAENIDEQ